MSTTPMLDPTGTPRSIPNDQIDAAKQAGGQVAYQIIDPATNTAHWIGDNDLPAAVGAGGLPANMHEAMRVQAQMPKRSTAPEDSWMEDKLETLQNIGLVSPFQAGFIRKSARSYEQYSDGLFSLIRKIPGADKVLDMSGSDAVTRGLKTMGNTPVETGTTSGIGAWLAHQGEDISNVYQFMLNSDAFKALSEFDQVRKLTGFMGKLNSMPRLKSLVTNFVHGGAAAGATSAEQQQTGAETLTNAVLTGGISGLTGFLLPGTGGAEAPSEEAAAARRQKGAQWTVKDVTQNAARQSLERLNATRTPITAESRSARLLPAPAGEPDPHYFELETEPQETTRTPGKMALEPAEKVVGVRPVYNAEIPDRPEGFAAKPKVTVSGDPVVQLLSSAKPGQIPLDAGLSGGGVYRIRGAQNAQLALDAVNDFLRDPDFKNLDEEQQARATRQRDGLQQQLDIYNAYEGYGPHFAPVPTDELVQQISTPGQAASQLRQAVEPVYKHLDEISNNRFGELRKAEQSATELLRNRTLTASEEAGETARLQNARDGMMRIFDENRSTINPQEWRAANQATRDAFLFDDIHTFTERATNRIAPEDVKAGRPRILTDQFTREFSTLLNKPGNRAELTRLLGPDGIDNMLDVSGILQDPQTRKPAADLATEIAMQILPKFGPKGYAMRQVLRMVMARPAGGKMFTYALKNDIAPRTAAPLISTALRGLQQQNRAEEEKAEEALREFQSQP